MTLELREINERIAQIDEENREYHVKARMWEKMWKLEYWSTTQEQAHAEGREQVTLPDPLNIVHLSERFRRDQPEIHCPPSIETNADEPEGWAESARVARQQFLSAAWQQNDRQQRAKIMAHAWWLSLVRGRCVFELRMIDDVLPRRMKKRRLPFQITVADPLDCGFYHGPVYTEWAFKRTLGMDRTKLQQIYPDFDFEEAAKLKAGRLHAQQSADVKPPAYQLQAGMNDEIPVEHDVVEFWYLEDGKVHLAVLIDEMMAMEPTPTPEYDDIPLVEVLGDDFPIKDQEHRSHSILRPIEDIWAAENRQTSQLATSLLWHYWPQVVIEGDDPVDTTTIGPGHDPIQVRTGTKLSLLSPQPNLPISDRLMEMYAQQKAQSSYPPTLFGSTTGGTNSGLEAAIHQSAARGRIMKFRENMQMGMEIINEMLLCIVENLGEIEIKGNKAFYDAEGRSYYAVTLTKDQINGEYDNSVNIEPEVPQETNASDTLALRVYETGLAASQTTRNNMSWEFPPDEQERVYKEQYEKAMREAEAQTEAMILQAAAQMQMQQEMQAAQQAQQPQQMPGQMPPGGQPGPGGPLQPDAMAMGMNSQENEGQLTEEQLAMDSPAFQDLMNSPTTAQQLQNLNDEPNNGRPT